MPLVGFEGFISTIVPLRRDKLRVYLIFIIVRRIARDDFKPSIIDSISVRILQYHVTVGKKKKRLSLPNISIPSCRNIVAVTSPYFNITMSTYTPEQLSATLERLDQQVKTGILEGNITEVMEEITPEVVSDNYLIYKTYLDM